MNVNTLVKAKRCVAIIAILPISLKTASSMLQHVHDSWLIFPSTIKCLLMNAKNSDFGYHALHQLFYNSYLCANAGFEKKSTIKMGWIAFTKFYNEGMKKRQRKNDGCFQNVFFKSPSSLCCNELDKESFKRRSF